IERETFSALDPAAIGLRPRKSHDAADDFTQPARRRCHDSGTRKTQKLGDTATQPVHLACDEIEVASVVAADLVILAHDLGDRLDRAQGIPYFMCYRRRHLPERCQPLARRELTLEFDLLF